LKSNYINQNLNNIVQSAVEQRVSQALEAHMADLENGSSVQKGTVTKDSKMDGDDAIMRVFG